MVVSMRKGFSLGILLITLIILLNTSPSGATSASLLKDFHDLYATIADNMELEFLHRSNIGRMLADDEESFVTSGALIAGEAVLKTCGRGRSYGSCLPPPTNPIPVPDTCGIYKRGRCPKPNA
ncbi:Uncharacterized protein TCM_018909 [Theobroma cacao]|uniref:Uncharacterized protein n=1 Tax=Theobroma cacao TaxID=3641 RepID=A0A061EFH5_THECC|nr:Uncharacterized protein TCM_018909 [Theobroma cacao]